MKIQVIQLKRGAKLDLERLLVNERRPAPGEPIFESDNNKLKIGDGIHNYADLPYISGSDIVIEGALDGQILRYNGTLEKWEAVDLADNHSIEYGQDGLQIAGFDQSGQGNIPVSNAGGITWQTAPSQEEIRAAVEQAEAAAYAAGQRAAAAGQAQADAETAAGQAEQFRDQTSELLSKKFWWGTYSEYQTEIIGQGKLTEGTIYFIYDYEHNL